MTAIETPITKRDGKLTPESRDALADAYNSLPDGNYMVKWGEIKPGRTLQQLKGTRGRWMGIILKELGYGPHDNDYVYQQIKIACGYCEPKANPVTGEVEKVAVRTGGFSKDKFRQFMEDFRRYIEDPDTGLGIRLPDLEPSKAKI